MNKIIYSIENFVRNHSKAARYCISLSVIFSILGASQINYVVPDNPSSEFCKSSEEYLFFEDLAKEFGINEKICVILVKGEDVFTQQIISALRQLEENILDVAGIIDVYSLDDIMVMSSGAPRKLLPKMLCSQCKLDRARLLAFSHPLVAGHMLSSDGSTMLMIVRIDDRLQPFSELYPVIKKVKEIAATTSANFGLEILVTGLPVIHMESSEVYEKENVKLIVIVGLLTMLVAFVLFHSFSAILIVGLPPLLGVLWTIGILGWINVPLVGICITAPLLAYVVGFTDAIHLMMQLQRRVKSSQNIHQASLSVIHDIGIACGLTSLTTAVGFGSLMFTSVQTTRIFGFCCALGTIVNFFAVIILTPILVNTFLGDWCNLSLRQKPINQWKATISRVADFTVARAKVITCCSILSVLGFMAVSLQLRPDIKWIDSYPVESDARRAFELSEEVFGGSLVMYILLDWSEVSSDETIQLLPALAEVHKILNNNIHTANPLSLLNLVQSIIGPQAKDVSVRPSLLFPEGSPVPKEAVKPFLNVDCKRALVSTRMRDTGAISSLPTCQQLQNSLDKLSVRHKGVRFKLIGPPLMSVSSLNKITTDLWKSLWFAAVIIFSMIALVFQSIRYGLICIIPNILPLALLGAFIVFIGQTINMFTMITFVICLGICVDDTIHFLASYRTELIKCGNAKEAVQHSYFAVGKALITTTIIFITVYVTVAFSSIPMYRFMAVLSLIAFSAAIVGDLVILPALIICLWKKD